MSDRYRTLDEPGRSRFEVRGSEFLGSVEPASSVETAEAVVEDVAADHPDATHVVSAYRIRTGGGDLLRERADDDGEPSGSAGEPVLNVLQGRELEDIVAAVVRYYGGTKLGYGGLVRAYGTAVKEALDDATVVERRPRDRFVVAVGYDDSGTVRGVLESADVAFEARYEERVTFEVDAPEDEAPELRDRLRSATSGRAEIA